MTEFQNFIEGETFDEREARITAWSKQHPLVPRWCDCTVDDPGFRCYPEDGACACGIYKHHVHGQCGHVVQVG